MWRSCIGRRPRRPEILVNKPCLEVGEQLLTYMSPCNQYDLKDALQSEAFKALSEDEKICAIRHVTQPHSHATAFGYAVRLDNVEHMCLLLSALPLYHVFSKDRPKQEACDLLRRNKARWDSIKATIGQGDQQPVLDCEYWVNVPDRYSQIKFIATIMLAADVFNLCCEHEALDCMHHLLKHAPDLQRIAAPDGRYPLRAALETGSTIVSELYFKCARLGDDIDACKILAMNLSKVKDSSNIRLALDLLLPRTLGADLSKYRHGENEDTILNLLLNTCMKRLHSFDLNSVLEWTDLLLFEGADPLEENRKGENSVDMLMACVSETIIDEPYDAYFRLSEKKRFDTALQVLQRLLTYISNHYTQAHYQVTCMKSLIALSFHGTGSFEKYTQFVRALQLQENPYLDEANDEIIKQHDIFIRQFFMKFYFRASR